MEAVLLEYREVVPVVAFGLALKGFAIGEYLIGEFRFLVRHEVGTAEVYECCNIAKPQQHGRVRPNTAVIGAACALVHFITRRNNFYILLVDEPGAHATIEFEPFPEGRRCPKGPALNLVPNGIECADSRKVRGLGLANDQKRASRAGSPLI